jgi:hypothetical protein
VTDPRDRDLPFATFEPFDCDQPLFDAKLETGVKNGDCLPACFCALLECLEMGFVAYERKQPSAAAMRSILTDWIKQNWEKRLVFNRDLKVHEVMRFAHDFGISNEERAKRSHDSEWGETAADHMKAYSRLCERVYFSDAEMLLFSSMIFERRGLPIVFRTWRCTGALEDIGEFVSCTPDPAILELNGISSAVIVDLAHVGIADSTNAHWKLLDSGSLLGLTEVRVLRPPTPAPTAKRRRLIKSSELTEAQRVRLGEPPIGS